MTSMHCNFCDQTSPLDSLFCKACGSPFHLAPCPNCAAVNEVAAIQCYKCGLAFDINRVAKVAPEEFKKNLIADPDALAIAVAVNSSDFSAVISGAAETDPSAIQSPSLHPEKSKLPNQPDQQMISKVVASTLVNNAAYPDTIPFLPKSELNSEFKHNPETERLPWLESANASDELPSVDLVARARWGQRALLALLALLCVVAAAYFFLRSEPAVLAPGARPVPVPTPSQAPVPSPLPAPKASANPAGLSKPPG